MAYPNYPLGYYDDSYDWSDNGPPYRPDSQVDDNPKGNSQSVPSSAPSQDHLKQNGNLTSSANLDNDGSVQNSVQNNEAPQPEPAPNPPAKAVQPETDSDRPSGDGQATI